ncbi:Uncharacterised protein [uncultured archaeon]|nr:Uncharacterised protein [uncultured archaeon]
MQRLKANEKPCNSGSAGTPEKAQRGPFRALMEYNPKSMVVESLLQALRSKDDGTYLDALVELRNIVLSKKHGDSEIFVTQKIIDAASNAEKEPQKRLNALCSLREIAMQRCENRELVDKIANSMPKIFRNKRETSDVREGALSNFYEIARHSGFSLRLSKELIHSISETMQMIFEDSLTYRYLAASALQELAKHAIRKKNSQLEAEIAKTLGSAYEKTRDADIHRELDCISQMLIQGSG